MDEATARGAPDVDAIAAAAPARRPGAGDVVDLLGRRAVHAVFQPVVAMDGAIVGYEALARMDGGPDGPDAPPDVWLAAADEAGLRSELEVLCIHAALDHGLPPGGALLFVNLSPSALAVPAALHAADGLHHRLVLELSESEIISDYEATRDHLLAWTALGTRVAIDDTGSGYASLRHVVQLSPDFIKLDRSLVDGLEHDRNRRALARALVAFAGELGAAVVAEGVERAGELEFLRAVGIGLVQGYLVGRPGPPWPAAADVAPIDGATRPVGIGSLARRLAAAPDPRGACEAVVDHLAHREGLMPSAYLLHGDRLRCQAQRGLWQVLDGLPPGIGITGRSYLEGRELVVDDVASAPGYLEAIPGIVAEACLPIRVEGVVVGALNVDARRRLTPDDLADMRHAAALLGLRLQDVGRVPTETEQDRLDRHLRRLLATRDRRELVTALLGGALRLGHLDTGVLTLVDDAGVDRVVAARGPLRRRLTDLDPDELAGLVELVRDMTSCYTAGSTLGRSFIGMDDLRRTGVRALAVVPLRRGPDRHGLLVLANSAPCALTVEEVVPIELLAAVAARHLDGLPDPGW